MSAQSGITATPELLQAFSKAQQSSHCRALVIHIDKEALVPGSGVPKQASEAKDFEQLAGVLQESDPCYVAFKLDNGTCMLVAYVPNDANVRAKMLVGPSSLPECLPFDSELIVTVSLDTGHADQESRRRFLQRPTVC